MNEMAVASGRALQSPRSASTPSLWLVAALLIAHQAALTMIHYLVGPALGFDPTSASLTATTIVLGAVVMLGLVALDARKAGRTRAVLLVGAEWDRSTILTTLVGLAVAQIPLGILALQGATVWQSGSSSNLEVGRALIASMAGPSGIALLIATVVVAPIVEEVLYRGYLLGTLVDRGWRVVAVLISALLFVTLHFEPANLVASLCLGVGTGLCAVQSRSIVPGLIVHIASNAFGMWYATLAS